MALSLSAPPSVPLPEPMPRPAARGWQVIPVQDLAALGATIADHHLFDLAQEGFGLLRKARALAEGRTDRANQVLGGWLAVEPLTGRPLGVALVTRSQVVRTPFLKGTWITSLDLYVRQAHRRQGIGRALAQAAQVAFPWMLAYHSEASTDLYAALGLPNAYAMWEMALEDDASEAGELCCHLRQARHYRDALAWWARRHRHNPTVQKRARAQTFASFQTCETDRQDPALRWRPHAMALPPDTAAQVLREHHLFDPQQTGAGMLWLAHLQAQPAWNLAHTVLEAGWVIHAHRQGPPVGLALVHSEIGTWTGRRNYTLQVFVQPGHRRQGLAKALAQAALVRFPILWAHHTSMATRLFTELGLQDLKAWGRLAAGEFPPEPEDDPDQPTIDAQRQAEVRWWAEAHPETAWVQTQARTLLADSQQRIEQERLSMPTPPLPPRPRPARSWLLKPAIDLNAFGATIADHDLFQPDETGFGLLNKAQLLVTGNPDNRGLVVLGAWVATRRSDGQPLGVAMVSQHRVLKDPFLRGKGITCVDVYVSPTHRHQGLGVALATAAQRCAPWAMAYHTRSAERVYDRLGLVNGYGLWQLMDDEGSLLSVDQQVRGLELYRSNLAWWAQRHPHDPVRQEQFRSLWEASLQDQAELQASEGELKGSKG